MHSPKDVLELLISDAAPFIDSIQATPADLAHVRAEFLALRLHDLLRHQLAGPLAKRLGIPVDDLRKLGSGAKAKTGDFVDPEPWPDPVDGDQLLTELRGLVGKHVVLDDAGKIAATLWIVV